jgi:hypothetical protein
MLNLKSQSLRNMDQLRFFAGVTAQYHMWDGPEKPWEWLPLLPEGARNVVEVWAGSRDEAQWLAGQIGEACGRS